MTTVTKQTVASVATLHCLITNEKLRTQRHQPRRDPWQRKWRKYAKGNSPRARSRAERHAMYLIECIMTQAVEVELRALGWTWRDFEKRRIPQTTVEHVSKAVYKAFHQKIEDMNVANSDTGAGPNSSSPQDAEQQVSDVRA